MKPHVVSHKRNARTPIVIEDKITEQRNEYRNNDAVFFRFGGFVNVPAGGEVSQEERCH